MGRKAVIVKKKPNFSRLTAEQALQLVPTQDLKPWKIETPQRPPSALLLGNFQRFQVFELLASEAAKVMLIDSLLAEVVPDHPQLKIWKAAPLASETVAGVADYLIAPKRGYLKTPLLCAIEAKRDDFEAGQTQCVAEMAVCQHNNRRDGHNLDVYGIVSNGQGWVFYKLTTQAEVLFTDLYTTGDLPKLLGMLDYVCAACARNVPPS